MSSIKTISILGCGWLGLPLAERLIAKGYRVKGSTTRKEKIVLLENRGIEAHLIKIGETIKADRIADFFQTDVLLINIPPGGRRNPQAAQNYPAQIRRLIQAAFKAGVRKIIFVSSTGVYGPSRQLITEADPPNPVTASGKALVEVENWLRKQKDARHIVLRLAGLTGGDRKAGRFLAGKKNVAKGSAPVNLIHREDCILIICELLRQEKWGEIYNACSDLHPTRREFYIYQAQKEGLIPPDFLEEEDSPVGKIISSAKLKRELGYTFLFPNPMKYP